MRARYRRAARAAASAALTYVVLKLEDLGLVLLRFAGARRQRRYEVRLAPPQRREAPAPPEPTPPEVADERTMRRIAEAQNGGMSSAEGTERWLRGENPGGLHHKAQRRPEDEPDMMPERERPEQEEPQGRKERMPGGERHLPENRRGT
jgi:hypothetical protein